MYTEKNDMYGTSQKWLLGLMIFFVGGGGVSQIWSKPKGGGAPVFEQNLEKNGINSISLNVLISTPQKIKYMYSKYSLFIGEGGTQIWPNSRFGWGGGAYMAKCQGEGGHLDSAGMKSSTHTHTHSNDFLGIPKKI